MTALPVYLLVGFSPLVGEGDAVTVGQVIAKRVRTAEEVIDIAMHLSVPAKNVKSLLKKGPGETVAVGDILAVKKKLFGLDTAILRSKMNGTVLRYERESGHLVIRTAQDTVVEEIFSPVDGVVGLCNNEEIVINTQKQSVAGKLAVGTNAEAELFVLEESFADPIDSTALLFQLGSGAVERIMVGKRFTREVLAKGMGIGALGVIGTDIDEDDISYLVAKFPKVPVLVVEEEVMRKLVSWKGRKVFIDAPSNSIVFLQR